MCTDRSACFISQSVGQIYRSICKQPFEQRLDDVPRLFLFFSGARLANGKRQFLCDQQVVGLIAHDAGWKENSSLRVESLLQQKSDKEQQ